MLKKILIGVVAIIVIAALANGGSKSTTTITPAGASPAAIAAAPAAAASAAPQAKVGDTVKSGNWSYRVTKVEKTKTLVWSDFGNKTDALGTWLVVSTTLQNIGKQNFPINIFDFQVLDSTGVKYDHSTSVSLFVSYRKLTSLGTQFPPGVDVQTALLFDVNPNATGLKLLLKQADGATIALD